MSSEQKSLEALNEEETEDSEFETVQIKNLGEIVTGSTPSTKQDEFYGGSVPFIKVSDINSEHPFVEKTDKTLTEEGAEDVASRELQEGAVMVTCIGSIGKNAVTTERCFTNQQINSIVPKDTYDHWYLYYKLETLSEKLEGYSGGSAHSILSKTNFSEMDIEIQSSKEVRDKIGEVLSDFDKKIRINNRINEILEEMAQGLFKSWFVDFEPYKDFKDSELEEIPESFEVKEIGDVLSLEYGDGLSKDDRDGGKYPVYGSNGANGSHSEYLVEGPGIIVGRKGTIGTVKYEPENFWCIDTTFYVEPKEDFDMLFYYHLLKNGVALKHLGSDSAVPGLNRNTAHDQKVAIPPKEEVERFVETIKPLYEKKEDIKAENEHLEDMRDTLLPKLMSGEIRVNVDGDE